MEKNLILEYFVPIESSAELDGEFMINGIAINETTTSNGHKFIGEELDKAAHTLIGVPLLKDHNNSVDSIVGKVNTAYWDEGLRNIPFKAVVKDNKVKQLIRDGLLNSVSVGAQVDPKDIEQTEEGDIIPHNIQFKELSVVAVPADGGATFSVALNNAYKSHSTKVDQSIEKEVKMTENEKTESDSSQESEEAKVDEEAKLDEEIKALRIKSKRKELKALMEADADEVVTEPVKTEEPEAQVKPSETPEPETEDPEEEEIVEETGDYKFNSGHKSIGIERKSYVY